MDRDGQKEEDDPESIADEAAEELNPVHKRKISRAEETDYTADVKTISDPFECLDPLEDQSGVLRRFENDQSQSWTLETLQLVRLFEKDLDRQDPFYIPGQEVKQKPKPVNPYQKKNFQDNFIDSEALDDPDAYEQLQPKAPEQPKTQYKKFHEILPSYRLAILLFLCQNKLDTETPEFMQELQRIAKTKEKEKTDKKKKGPEEA